MTVEQSIELKSVQSREIRQQLKPATLRAASDYVVSQFVPFDQFQSERFSGETMKDKVKQAFRLYGDEMDNVLKLLSEQDFETNQKVFGNNEKAKFDGDVLYSVDPFWQERLDFLTQIGSHYNLHDYLAVHQIKGQGPVYGLHRELDITMTIAQALSENYPNEKKKRAPRVEEIQALRYKKGELDEIRTGEAIRVMAELAKRYPAHIIGEYYSEARFMGETGVDLGQPLHKLYSYLIGESEGTELSSDSRRLLEFLGFPNSPHYVDVRYNPSLDGTHVRIPNIGSLSSPEESLILTLRTDNNPRENYSTRVMWISEEEWDDPKMFMRVLEKDPHEAEFRVNHPSFPRR